MLWGFIINVGPCTALQSKFMLPLWFYMFGKCQIENLRESGFRLIVMIDVWQKQIQILFGGTKS